MRTPGHRTYNSSCLTSWSSHPFIIIRLCLIRVTSLGTGMPPEIGGWMDDGQMDTDGGRDRWKWTGGWMDGLVDLLIDK